MISYDYGDIKKNETHFKKNIIIVLDQRRVHLLLSIHHSSEHWTVYIYGFVNVENRPCSYTDVRCVSIQVPVDENHRENRKPNNWNAICIDKEPADMWNWSFCGLSRLYAAGRRFLRASFLGAFTCAVMCEKKNERSRLYTHPSIGL